MSNVNKPILVTGSHRSGTSWAGKIISLAPEVQQIWEPFNLYNCGIFKYISNENEDFYYKYILDIINFSCFSYYHYYCIFIEPTQVSNDLYIQINLIIKRIIKRNLKLFVWHLLKIRMLLKDPIAVFSAEWLSLRFNMDVVVLIRHPAAFVSSLKRLEWSYPFSTFLEQPLLMQKYLYPFEAEIHDYAKNEKDLVDQGILLWKLIYSVVSIYQRKHSQWCFIRHEDISIDPIEEFKSLFCKLNLRFTDKVIKEINYYCDVENPAEAPEGKAHALRRNSKANIWNWKTRLSPSEITKIRKNLSDISDRFYSDQDW